MADNNLYGIIGVGRFGLSLAENLANDDKTIFAIDKDPQKLTDIGVLVQHIFKKYLKSFLKGSSMSHSYSSFSSPFPHSPLAAAAA